MDTAVDTAMDAGRWIPRGEALARLGVKTQTLYAYVSRGRIAARPDPVNPRRSLYAAADVARLTGDAPAEPQGRNGTQGLRLPSGPSIRGEADVQSSLTVIAGGRLFYRGFDAAQLSQHATAEDVARRLWELRDRNPFPTLPPPVGSVSGVATLRAKALAVLARRAEEDATPAGRDPELLKDDAAATLNEVIDTAAGVGPRMHFHQRLARAWKVVERDSHLIRRALVLAADHELNASVVAARAAASGGATVAGAALAGLATFCGSPALAEVSAASAFVAEARRDPAAIIGRRMEAGVGLPGLSASVYPGGDPRAAALLDAAHLPADLAAVLQAAEVAAGRPAGFALALALVARRLDLPKDGAADVLMLGRLTGLLGHALDQLIDGSPIRARLRYVGPEAGAN
jgi:citrate synthase